MDDLQSALLLLATISGLGAAAREQTVVALLAESSRPAVLGAIVEGRPEELPGWTGHGTAAQELRSGSAMQRAVRKAQQCRLAGITVLFRGSEQYPPRLTDLEAAPPVLFVRGAEDALLEHRGWVAMVGSRQATQLGLRFARRSAEELAGAGLTVVSGLALGTDAAVHQGALDAGGRTVAVLASGVDVLTPQSNAQLGRRMLERGAVVSEYPPGTPVRRWAFPNRNRIIAALATTVVILEAGLGSGTTLTAEAAAELNRNVFVMPGRPGDAATAGGLELLGWQNVNVFRNSSDVLPYYPGVAQERRVPSGPGAELIKLARLMSAHLPCRTDQLPELLGLTEQIPVLLGSINLLKMHRILHEDSAGYLNLVAELPRQADLR